MEENGIGLEHLLAGAIRANDGALTFPVEAMLHPDNEGKQIAITVDGDMATVELVDPEEV